MTKIITDLQSALSLVKTDALSVLEDQQKRAAVGSDEFGSCSVALRQFVRVCEAFELDPDTVEAVKCKPAKRNERQKLIFTLHYWCSRISGACAFLPETARKCAAPRRTRAAEQLNAKQQLAAGVINLGAYVCSAERALTPFLNQDVCAAG